MKRLLLIAITFMLLLNSCVSTDEQLVLDSTPSWTTGDLSKFSKPNTLYYTIAGSGASENLAKTNALSTFYDVLNKSVIISEKNEFIASLGDNYFYDPFEMKIEKKYLTKLKDQLYDVVYLISASKSKIDESKLLKAKNEGIILDDLAKLEEESDFLYRDNQDYKSIQTLIKAFIVAKENKYDAKANIYLRTIISRISFLDISVFAKNDSSSLELRVNREQALMKPLVENAKLVAQYNGKDISFKNYLVKEPLLPIKNNTFVFNYTSKNINPQGLVIFKIDLEEEINLLRHKNFHEAANRIENIIEELVFSYNEKPKYSGKKVIVTTIENNINQERRESASTSFFVKKLTQQEAEVLVDLDLDIENISAVKNKADYLFIFRAEIVEREEGFRPFALSHGSLEIYDLNTLSIIFNSDLVDGIAIKDTMEESEKESFINIAKRVYFNSLW